MDDWKTYIDGFYEASPDGFVRSVDRTVLFKGTPGIRKGIILKPTVNSRGYLTVVICKEGTRKTESVHRIIAKTFLSNPMELPEVNHKDGNVFNNSVDNLEWITQEDNHIHAFENGLISAGNVKLTAKEVAEIKWLIHKGLSNPEIAELFGVDRATIRNIRIGKNWTHVKMAVESQA
jgi:hypothetical protein